MRTPIAPYQLLFLPPGTIVSAFQGGIEHFGVLTEQHLFGQPATIISASKRRKSVVEELPETFAPGQQLYSHQVWSNQAWQQTMFNARSKLGTPYRLSNRNCEHFVRFCHGLPEESPQLAKAVVAALASGVVVLALASLRTA